MDLQKQYDSIYSFFKKTTEPFDILDWDGKVLDVWLKENKIESYKLSDLGVIIQPTIKIDEFLIIQNNSWKAIFDKYSIHKHNFDNEPFLISAEQIKQATSHFKKTNEKEVRILCYQDTQKHRPQIFIDNGVFLLPIKNGEYAIVKGEGYIDIPEITATTKVYSSKLGFKLDTSLIGSSEMQHLDFAYASSLVRTFLKDDTLVLTIRGRKYTPKLGFSFYVNKQLIEVKSVQTEVDAGYEGKNQVALIEAKNSKTNNTIIRQLYYPFRQWSHYTKKPVKTLFFEKRDNYYSFWQFDFDNINDYNSIKLSRSQKFEIEEK